LDQILIENETDFQYLMIRLTVKRDASLFDFADQRLELAAVMLRRRTPIPRRLSLHRRRWHESIRTLSLCAAGEAFLTSEDVVKRSANFLREELEDRLRTGPAAFRLPLQLAEAGDRTDDVTALWPEGRLAVALGI
jgi:hypothetical protein